MTNAPVAPQHPAHEEEEPREDDSVKAAAVALVRLVAGGEDGWPADIADEDALRELLQLNEGSPSGG